MHIRGGGRGPRKAQEKVKVGEDLKMTLPLNALASSYRDPSADRRNLTGSWCWNKCVTSIIQQTAMQIQSWPLGSHAWGKKPSVIKLRRDINDHSYCGEISFIDLAQLSLLSKNNLGVGGGIWIELLQYINWNVHYSTKCYDISKETVQPFWEEKNSVSTNCLWVTKIVGFSTKCNHASHLRKGCWQWLEYRMTKR